MAHHQGIEVGLEFGTFTEFEEALKAYEKQSGESFYRSNSKTLKKYYTNGKYKDLTSEGYKEDLVFREAAYKCISRKTNDQRKKPTNCKASITLGVKDKKLLIIKKFTPEHDHSSLQTEPTSEDDHGGEATTENDAETEIETQPVINRETELEIEIVLTTLKEYLRGCSDDELDKKLDDVKKMMESWGHMVIVEAVIEFPFIDKNGNAIECINIPESQSPKRKHEESEEVELENTGPEKVSSLLSNDDVPSSLSSESVIASEKESAEKGDTKAGPTAYAKKTESERSETLLRWLHLPEEVLQNTLEHKYRIMKHDIDIDPHVLKDSFIDDEVKISSMKNFFVEKVFVQFQAALKKKKEGRIRNCGTCTKKIMRIMRSGVKCDSCLIWYHLKCASLKRPPNNVEWFCPNCL